MGKALMCRSQGILFKFRIFAALNTSPTSYSYFKSKNELVDETSTRFYYFSKKGKEKFVVFNPSTGIDRSYRPLNQIMYFIPNKLKGDHFLIKEKKSFSPL
jgi:hypothetical protein